MDEYKMRERLYNTFAIAVQSLCNYGTLRIGEHTSTDQLKYSSQF